MKRIFGGFFPGGRGMGTGIFERRGKPRTHITKKLLTNETVCQIPINDTLFGLRVMARIPFQGQPEKALDGSILESVRKSSYSFQGLSGTLPAEKRVHLHPRQ